MPDGSLNLRVDSAEELQPNKRRARLPRLPDQLTIKYGPTEAIGRFVLYSDQALRRHGVRLSLSTNADELAQVNAERVGKDWYRLPPIFDPVFSPLNDANFFWIKGVNDAGEIVVAEAARLYVWPDTTLRDEIEALRLLYGPTKVDIPGASGRAPALAAAQISGRVGYAGALWVRQDYRGHKLSQIVAPLIRAIALTKWYPDYQIGFVSLGSPLAQTYKYSRADPAIHLTGLPGFDRHLDFSLCWMVPVEIEAQIADALADQKPLATSSVRQTGVSSHVV